MKEVFEKAILTYGQTAQEDVAIEEMSELIKAICKMRRAGVNEKPAATDAIVDEIADVSIIKAVGIVLLLSCPVIVWACLVVSGRFDDD